MVRSITESARPNQPDASDSALLSVRQVAAMLDCSTRHVSRLSEAGRLPAPVRIGSLVRWNRSSLLHWMNSGCGPVGNCPTTDLVAACDSLKQRDREAARSHLKALRELGLDIRLGTELDEEGDDDA